MRTALVSLVGQPRIATGEVPLTIGGKTLARRQLDFAIEAGCEAAIVLGDGASAEAISLRHAAECEGVRFRAIRDAHGLLGAVRADDDLLVLAPGLLPEASEGIEALAKGRRVLVFPAGPAVPAGFERIDVNRAWAGALLVGGAQVERLSDLPADIEPASALLRIALQASVRETPLPDDLLAGGTWRMIGERADQVASERAWLDRHAPAASPFAPTRWLVRTGLREVAGGALSTPRLAGGLALGGVAGLAVALLAARYGWPLFGFILIALGALLAQGAADVVRLRAAPFDVSASRARLLTILPWLIDGALVGCLVLTIEGTWLHRLFPPLVMAGLLLGVRPEARADWTSIIGDRGLLAIVLAVGAGFGVAEPVIMIVSLILIALNLARAGARSG